jgi:hypothetical protein
MIVAIASFSGFHGNVTLHCHWKYSLLALLQPYSGGVSLQNFALFPTFSTRIAKHRLFIKLKLLQNFCSSCKTLADQVAHNPRFYCIFEMHSSIILPPTLSSKWSGFSGRGDYRFLLFHLLLSTCLLSQTPGFHHYKLWNSLLCNFIMSPLLPNNISSLLTKHPLFNPQFKRSHFTPIRTAHKITVPYNLVSVFLDGRWESHIYIKHPVIPQQNIRLPPEYSISLYCWPQLWSPPRSFISLASSSTVLRHVFCLEDSIPRLAWFSRQVFFAVYGPAIPTCAS